MNAYVSLCMRVLVCVCVCACVGMDKNCKVWIVALSNIKWLLTYQICYVIKIGCNKQCLKCCAEYFLV